MITLVTFGPTQEPLDAMRIISNRSTGTLGTQLALTLCGHGHQVIALRGTGSTAETGELLRAGIPIHSFTTTQELDDLLKLISQTTPVDALYHAAAVSDYYFPKATQSKISTASGALTLTLEPTPKILPRLRTWFPAAHITGWKFESSETGLERDNALAAAREQIDAARTDACVLNGTAYGSGFGYLASGGAFMHLPNLKALCDYLSARISG